jgi:phage terminase Nu1 subunit (DNA packaging protein)
MPQEVDIRSLSVAEAAELLGLSVETVREHVARGLPLRRDGRVDLVVYAAWLNTEEARAADARA